MKRNYNPDPEYHLFSDGLPDKDSEHFQSTRKHGRTIALICNDTQVGSVAWREFVQGLPAYCFLCGSHAEQTFHQELATAMLNAGALSVVVRCYQLQFDEWHCYSSVAYRPEVLEHVA